MGKEKMILNTYMLLKDCLEDDDDFEKMHNLIEQMAAINAEKAFDMWYPLLKKYENIVCERHVNATYYLVNQNLDVIGDALGYSKFDAMILSDNYLYELLIKKYCYTLNHYNYTQKMVERMMASNQIDLSDKIFSDAYGNGNNSESWFDIIDGFLHDIKYSDFNPGKEAIVLISKWAGRIEGNKDKAKIMSAMLATGLDFEFDLLNQSTDNSLNSQASSSPYVDDSVCFKELLHKYPEVITDRLKLKSLLSDYYPENKLYSNLILMVFDEGLVMEIKAMDGSDFLKKQRLVSRIINNYGISEDLACLAIDAWHKGLK